MKDIFLIVCPLTDEIKGISKGTYGHIPSSICKDPDFPSWKKMLKKKGLRPVFELIDVVEDDETALFIEMYLGLFKSWNISLLSSSYLSQPITSVITPIIRSENKSDKFLLDDLLDMHKILRKVTHHFRSKKITSGDRMLIHELTLLCSFNTYTEIGWKTIICKDITDCRRILQSISKDLRVEKESTRTFYLESCLNNLIAQNSNEYNRKVFNELPKYSLQQILTTLNHIFAYFQYRVFYNEKVWVNSFHLSKFLQFLSRSNFNHEVVEVYYELMSDKKKNLDVTEFNNITRKMQTLFEGA